MTENLGAFADAARAREDELARRLAASVAADKEFQAILREAVRNNSMSRQRLDALESEIRQAANTWPGLDTPAGSRQFQQFLNGKTREIHRVVADAAADSEHRASLVRSLTTRYRFGGDDGGDPHIRLVDNEIPADVPPPHDPTIEGPGSQPVPEKQDGSPYDLGATIPGTGIVITGDPETGHPRLHIPGQPDIDNPFPVDDGFRALPTGTAIGPDGQQYAFYSVRPYGPGTSPDNFIAPESRVQNLADPATDLGPLMGTTIGSDTKVGISQASGAYDAASGRMIIVGNVGQDGQRAMWQSDPVRAGDPPNAWMNNLQQVGTFNNLGAADRENQIVSLPQGGYLLTSASNGGQIVGVTAGSPQGLLQAPSQDLTGPGFIPSPGNQPAVPYGPSIVNVETLPNGQEQVTMRVSTWPTPEGWPVGESAPPVPYHPRTYTTTFNINP
ncbi:hypothetical protein MTER_00880 [Mycolicibacter terrae]|uniref:Biofilm regulator BssS n=1 Tax=Mycolicibacter terrae TaxID=1788 RepID=A0AAD1HSL5_9MYCO|nr:DUF4226 domain-containing protein [Mycolicibacter terrae]ORW95052.1 hypothetical protein AWC28_11605 [Mycolicibacter terrae]BBX20677.1 hypothetical protein MTER_00880 [Mycolicibacter terrae]SNV94369.1 Biofilm regulator BssS [Mycolicibacter terrae]